MTVTAIFLDARVGDHSGPGQDGGQALSQSGGWGQSLCFGQPEAERRAHTLPDIPGLLHWAEAQARAGRWVALALAYEAAPAFDPALEAHPPAPGLPLAWAASFAAPLADMPAAPGQYAAGPFTPLVSRADYDRRLERLRGLIAEGETYQANYTLPFQCAFAGDDRAWFTDLARAQRAGFCAWLDLGGVRILSLSPELFFSVRQENDRRLALARPMKGTAARGATPAEDEDTRRALAACPKNRAENVMIVDLLRNDLGRVAVPGGVTVPRLFRVEAYPTVFQMTSDVSATLRPGASLFDLLSALFPCGSVTGAPKIRTMQLLRELEPHPRGVYCGAIGLLSPHCRTMTFSVPIRTVSLQPATGAARFGVGGGVTWDSTPGGEWAECRTKMRFLSGQGQDFALIESLLLRKGRYPLLRWHLARLARSAAFFSFPLSLADVQAALLDHSLRHPEGSHKVRLLLSPDGSLTAEAAPITPARAPLRIGWADTPVHSADLLLRHKTTRRARFDRALASRPACSDLLFLNERGEVTESTRANLVLHLDGRLVTPPLSSGLLPGTFRAMLLAHGRLHEQPLSPADVARAQAIWLVNSVRGWMRCVVEGRGEGM